MYITEPFVLDPAVRYLFEKFDPNFGFGGFGAAVYYRTYSRIRPDGRQERWHDTVERVVNGLLSIRKTHYINNGLLWDESLWQNTGAQLFDAIFFMRILPPGRGLWAMGTPYLAERGAMALYNCAAVDVVTLSESAGFLMDVSMCGVGCGFRVRDLPRFQSPRGDPLVWQIPDTREGWVESVERLIASFEQGSRAVDFDYSLIRAAGEPIRGFGGTSAGPAPLAQLHDRICTYCESYIRGETTSTRLIADVMNAIGCCVVAGNVRRSAEIALGKVTDVTFMDLKNYAVNPDRGPIGWASNNSVVLEDHDDFLALPDIADRIRDNGEPGIFNMINIQKYGRLFREMPDAATLTNPCGEIALESHEVCNLVEVFPTRCINEIEFFNAISLATLYASTVSLLPTHRPETNAVVARNRRIGVSLSGIADWTECTSMALVVRQLRDGYRLVRERNRALNREAGVPESIRVTTVKPSGTVSQLAGVSSGMHWPEFPFAIRRMRAGANTPYAEQLVRSGVPYEDDVVSDNTLVFSFPLDHDHTRPVTDVSVWQQASRVAMLQREWADNMVSNTIKFNPATEAKDVEHVLAEFAPITKTMSMLPHTPQGAYAQMPYEGIDRDTYARLVSEMPQIDWSGVEGSDGQDDRYCSGDSCQIIYKTT